MVVPGAAGGGGRAGPRHGGHRGPLARSRSWPTCAATEIPTAPPVEPLASTSLLSWRGDQRIEDLDLADVHGMADARFALEVAAAGGHHLMLSGPKGAGKTTLAERLPGLLPDLTVEESLELTAIYSLSGGLASRRGDAVAGRRSGRRTTRRRGPAWSAAAAAGSARAS